MRGRVLPLVLGLVFGTAPAKDDAPLDLVGVGQRVGAADLHRTGGGAEVAGQHAERGGLAGAVQAEEADGLALVDLERDRPERPPPTVILGEVGDVDHEGSPRAVALARVVEVMESLVLL